MNGSRAGKRRAGSRSGTRTGGHERQSSMPRLRQLSCRTTWMPVRRALRLIAIVIVLAVCAGAAALWLGWGEMHQPYKGYSGSEQFVTIRQGAASGEIGRTLADAGIVSNARVFRTTLWWTRQGRNLKAGEYRFDHALTPFQVIDVIARGETYARKLTFPEGLTIEEMAKLYEQRGFGRARDFIAATR